MQKRSLGRTVAICYPSVNSILRVPPFSSLLSNLGVDATEARRKNLLKLEKQYSTLEAIGQKTDTSAAYLSQIKNETRNMGAKVARRIEGKLGLPRGWMDSATPHGAAQKPLGSAALLSDFEKLPPTLQDRVLDTARELRELVEDLSPQLRQVISAPPKDPQRYAEWEANIRALIASEGR